MSVFDMLGALLIGPLKLLFEVIFTTAFNILQNPGMAIIVLSLAMNILVLPLYRRADAIQIEARDTENKLKDVVAHIKKTFSGDERMMILQTYYRQNNYNPLSVLSGSLSLLLEIPFFMAAYQFLSSVGAFQGASFGPISNLGVPDGLLNIGGVAINVLPIIMTLVNVISSSLYLKGFPLKTKIQLYGMALFFLVFLYNSPAALVFYWTLNNTFSLLKTLYYRIKNSKLILNVLLGLAGAALVYFGCVMEGFYRSILVICLGIAAQLPWVLPLLLKKIPLLKGSDKPAKPNTKLFIMGAVFLTVLIGLLIPSTYIAASPEEFIDAGLFYNPIWYVVHTFCLSAGTFLVWLGVFYWLSNPKGKVIFSYIVWILSGIMLVNYMFFGRELGIVSPNLQYADGFWFARTEHLINIGVILVLFAGLLLLAKKFPKAITSVLLVGAIALTSMGVINIAKISKTAEETKQTLSSSSSSGELSFTLTTEGQNVVVIMLDRAIGPFLPYLMEENPKLLEQFDGFTYYANTLSYGGSTNFATPALYGGYEYTPANLNQRNTEKLVAKHNEALKVMPSVFAAANFDVTVIDPSYAGYKWIPDVSIYNDIPGVSAFRADGVLGDPSHNQNVISARLRNFFFFSVMKAAPVSLQAAIYNGGQYHALPSQDVSASSSFMEAYYVMQSMSKMTNVVSGAGNTFMFLRSNITHEPTLLQEPTFTPAVSVNNSAYYPSEGKTITANGQSYLLDTNKKIIHYHANMAALIQLGNWLDDLRTRGVYDNTRIIIVADHGRNLNIFDDDEKSLHLIEYYQPLLLVKDFNSTGFTTSEEFMTNADVPTLALSGLVENPVNPFTGKEINSNFKTENDKQYVIVSDLWDVSVNNGFQFIPCEWATVTGDVRDKSNWTFHTDLTVLPPDLQ